MGIDIYCTEDVSIGCSPKCENDNGVLYSSIGVKIPGGFLLKRTRIIVAKHQQDSNPYICTVIEVITS